MAHFPLQNVASHNCCTSCLGVTWFDSAAHDQNSKVKGIHDFARCGRYVIICLPRSHIRAKTQVANPPFNGCVNDSNPQLIRIPWWKVYRSLLDVMVRNKLVSSHTFVPKPSWRQTFIYLTGQLPLGIWNATSEHNLHVAQGVRCNILWQSAVARFPGWIK